MSIFELFTINGPEFNNGNFHSSIGGKASTYSRFTADVRKNFGIKFARGGGGGIISTTFHAGAERPAPCEYPSLADDKYVGPLKGWHAQIECAGCRCIIRIADPGYAARAAAFAHGRDHCLSSGGLEFMSGFAMRH